MAFDPMNLYYEKWLPRARKLLAPSGLLTELAYVMAKRQELPEDQVRGRLRRVLDGKEQPDSDFVFEVEQFVAQTRSKSSPKTEKTGELELAS